MTKRFLVVKMLTTFVDDVNNLENPNILYPCEKIDSIKFKSRSWMSSFFKILMQHYDINGFSSKNDVPEIVKNLYPRID